MSKDIWHTADEIPDFDKSYVELSRSLQGDLVYSTWGHPNYITPNTIKWCYMDDLLALETELERTRKALDVAVDALKEIDNTRSPAQHKMTTANGKTLNSGIIFCWTTPDEIHNALAEITALERKDK